MSQPCPVCTAQSAPRPSGTQTFTFSEIEHKAAECAAIASMGHQPRVAGGRYVADNGAEPCMNCFVVGMQHLLPEECTPEALRRRRQLGVA